MKERIGISSPSWPLSVWALTIVILTTGLMTTAVDFGILPSFFKILVAGLILLLIFVGVVSVWFDTTT